MYTRKLQYSYLRNNIIYSVHLENTKFYKCFIYLFLSDDYYICCFVNSVYLSLARQLDTTSVVPHKSFLFHFDCANLFVTIHNFKRKYFI